MVDARSVLPDVLALGEMVDARSVLPDVLALGETGKFNPRAVVSTVASWSDAPEALLEASTKLVIERPQLALV